MRTLVKCGECGEKVNEDSLCGVGDIDVCDECYYDLTNACQLCSERFSDEDTSPLILVKAELGSTGRRPPGIYMITRRPFMSIPMIGSGSLHGGDVLFVDKLPEFDRAYEISGHICNGCAAPFAAKCFTVYGADIKMYDEHRWKVEREHTRRTILANRDMLRDLECDPNNTDQDGKHLLYVNANDWEDIREVYDLPELPTYHELLFVEHQGVKVYETRSYRGFCNDVGWLALSPEPRYRCGAGSIFPQTFAASGLPTYVRDLSRGYYDNYDDSMQAVKLAIEQGFLKQDGCYDEEGKPVVYG